MEALSVVLIFGLVIALIVGLVNPSLILFWSKKPTRLKVFGWWFLGTVVASVLATMGTSDDGTSEKKEKVKKVSFEQFAYYERDNGRGNIYRIFVYITDADAEQMEEQKQMEEHAKKQTWTSLGTTMVCYFNSSEGLNSDAITFAKDLDAAIDNVWKPSMIARYMHWPTGKKDFQINPYKE
jgi:hypothetical protein